jgi:HSP20 family protein
MGTSPFHGIFSSLGQSAEDEVAPAQPQRAQEPGTGKLAVDIYEQDDYYIIRAPIAGVKLSDLDIEVNDNVLTIRGNRKQTDDVPEGQYYLRECFWGPFARSVTLPTQIDPRKVRATFTKDSTLKILVPKEERVKIVRINEA